MTKATSNARDSTGKKASVTAAKAERTYRGVVLQKPAVKSRFSEKQVDEAVRAAIAKNAHVFAGDN